MTDAIDAPRPLSSDKYCDSFMLHTVAPGFMNCKHQATFKNSKMLRMKTVQEIRYENLSNLVKELGAGDLTKMLEKSKSWLLEDSENRLSRPTLDQILKRRVTANNVVKNVGDELARKIEEEFRLERGWMDNEHGESRPQLVSPQLNHDQLSEVIRLFLESNIDGRNMIIIAARRAANITGALGAIDDKSESGSI